MKLKVLMIYVFCIFFLVACHQKLEIGSDTSHQNKFITSNVIFRAYCNTEQMLDGVRIVVIDSNGQVIDVLITDENGEVQKKLTVPIDEKYTYYYGGALETRGTVTAIAYKDGYRSVVIFEVPVEEYAVQPFRMLPKLTGERNEPIGILGNVHHLEINALVDKYSNYSRVGE